MYDGVAATHELGDAAVLGQVLTHCDHKIGADSGRQPLQSAHSRSSAAPLHPGASGLRRAHPSGQLALGQSGSGAAQRVAEWSGVRRLNRVIEDAFEDVGCLAVCLGEEVGVDVERGGRVAVAEATGHRANVDAGRQQPGGHVVA